MFTHQCCDKTYVFSWAEIFWYLCQNLVCSISFNTILNSKLHRTKRNTLPMRLKSKYLGKLGELRTIFLLKYFELAFYLNILHLCSLNYNIILQKQSCVSQMASSQLRSTTFYWKFSICLPRLQYVEQTLMWYIVQ